MRFFLFVFLLISSIAYADQTSNLTWTPPTTRVDGTPLNATEIKVYHIYREIDAPVTLESHSFDVAPAATATDTLTLSPRDTPYTINYFITVELKDGLVSVPSNVGTKTFLVSSTSPPNAPEILSINIVCNVGCAITEQ